MSVTVSDLIHSSFRLIGAVAAGEQLETSELNDAFVTLNQMLDSWNTEGASVVGRKRLVVFTQQGVNFYTLTERPIKIQAANLNSSGIDNPLDVVDADRWEQIDEKGALAIKARILYCDYQYPVSSVYVWPTPRLGGSLELWVYAPIPQFGSLADTVDMPEGYEMAVRYNLAVSLEPEYPRTEAQLQLLTQLAQMYKASIAQLNASNHIQTPQIAPPAAAPAAA